MKLAQYQWKNRIMLIFSPSQEDDRFARQLELFDQNRNALEERNIVVLKVVGPVEPRVRSQFRVGVQEFCAVLIGKDGNEKHRWSDVAPVEQISHRIDRMPMRRAEMRDR